MTVEKFFTSKLGVILAATGATFLWGSAFPFIKLSYEMLNIGSGDIYQQLLFAGYRFFLASILIFGFILLLTKKISYEKGTFSILLRIALFQTFLQYVFFYIGLSYSTGVQGSIIAGTTSFFQILLAHFMYKNDSLSTRKMIGLFIGFCGVVIVNLSNESFRIQFGIGEWMLLIAMFCGALGNILAKNGTAKMNILYLTAYQMIIGSIALIGVAVFRTGFTPFSFDWKSGFILLYLAFLSAAGFVLWNTVMKYNKVGKVSIYLFLIPVFGVFLSSIILHESVHTLILLALALVVSGIIIVNREKKTAHKLSKN